MNVFIAPKQIRKNIVESQLLPFLKYLPGNNVIWLDSKIHRKVYLPPFLKGKTLFYQLLFTRLLKEKSSINNIYTRSVFDFLCCFIIKKITFSRWKILYDFRASLFIEVKYRNRKFYRLWVIYILELFVFKKADTLNCVSNTLKSSLISLYGNRNINIIPCASSFKVIRNDEIKNQTIKFVYVGSLTKYQCFPETLKLMEYISQNIENSEFHIITLDVKEANTLLQGFDCNKFKVHSMNQEEVGEYISEMSFGFLLREDLPINNVSSPIKFAEYLSSGVIPIMTKGIGDYSELTVDENLGVVLSNPKELINIKQLYDLLNDDTYSRLFKQASKLKWEFVLKNFEW